MLGEMKSLYMLSFKANKVEEAPLPIPLAPSVAHPQRQQHTVAARHGGKCENGGKPCWRETS